MTAAPKRRFADLWLLLFVAAAVRAFLLLAPPDQLFDAANGASGRIYHEEILRGVAARDIAEGSLLPWLGWQVNDFWGGSLVVSVVAAPFYALFGDHLLCLRAVGVLFQLLLVAVVWCWTAERCTRRTAWMAGALVALPPFGFLASALMIYGTHLELCALQLLVAWLHLRAGPVTRKGWLLRGAAAGFAVYFGYSTVLLLGVLAAICFHTRDRGVSWRARLRDIAVPWAVGAAAGVLPVALRLMYSGGAVGVYDGNLFTHIATGVAEGTRREGALDGMHGPLQKWLHLWSGDLAQATFLPYWAGAALVLAVLVAGVSNLLDRSPGRIDWRHPGAAAAAIGCAWTASYAVTDFGLGSRPWVFDWRYLMPLWPWAALVLAVAGGRWIEAPLEAGGASPRLRRVAGWLVLLLPLGTGMHALAQADADRMPAALAENGSNDRVLVRFVVLATSGNPDPGGVASGLLESLGRRAAHDPLEQIRSKILARDIAEGLKRIGAAPPAEGIEAERSLIRRDRAIEALRLVTEGDPRPFDWAFGEAWRELHRLRQDAGPKR